MEQKLIRFLESHQIELKNKKVLVAVSGGPDSVALLHFLKGLRERWKLRLIAVTINHQLRDEAEEDVSYVEQLCNQWDIQLIRERVDVRAYQKRHKVSTQVAAREARYAVFAKILEEEEAHFLALGHHADDQIETLLMSLMRTTNLAGLSGIPFSRPFHQADIIRPLLAVSRKEIEQYCQQQNLRPRVDPSNQDTSYTRNYVRKLVVPKLKEKNPSLHITAQQLSQTLYEDELYLRKEAESAFHKVVKCSEGPKAQIDIAKLNRYAVSLQRRIYRLTLDYLYKNSPPHLSHSHEAILLSLITGNATNKRLHFPQNLMIEVVYDHIQFYFNHTKQESFTYSVENVPATVPLPDGNILEITYATERTDVNSPNQYVCHASQVAFPLQIRTREPGDRMRYKGLNGSKKIKDIFIDEKIPRAERDKMLILADDTDEILWIIGFRKGIVQVKNEEKNLYLSFTYKC